MTQDKFEQMNIGPSLSEGERQKLSDFLKHYCDVFAFNPNEMGDCHRTEHVINTGDALSVLLSGWRVGPVVREITWSELHAMHKARIIRPSRSHYSSPIILVKKVGGNCFHVDYLQLNDVTRADTYPAPQFDDTLDCLLGEVIFATHEAHEAGWYWENYICMPWRVAWIHWYALQFQECRSDSVESSHLLMMGLTLRFFWSSWNEYSKD